MAKPAVNARYSGTCKECRKDVQTTLSMPSRMKKDKVDVRCGDCETINRIETEEVKQRQSEV